ncbi:putative choline transporter, neither null mutation nor overexpression affects choline transport [Irineochytrium annulatum]|nr:putative choline transporter, neither null mutation nor overexpression affects choline transport [Irineochytrium annulatum]
MDPLKPLDGPPDDEKRYEDVKLLPEPETDARTGPPRNPVAGWDVLHQSEHRMKWQDWPFAILFLLALAFSLYNGIRGWQLLSNPAAYCGMVNPSLFDSGLPPSAPIVSGLYDNCIHEIITGDLGTARGRCIVFAVDTLTGGTAAGTASHRALFANANALKYVNLTNSIEKRALPTLIQDVENQCVTFLTSGSPTGPIQCLEYSLATLLSSSKTALSPALTGCVNPALSASTTAFATCADSALLAILPPSATSQLSNLAGSIFSNCTGLLGASNATAPSAVRDANAAQACIEGVLLSSGVQTSTITSTTSECISPALTGSTASAVPGCLNIALAPAVNGSSTAAGNLTVAVVDACITPLLNGTADAVGVASRCIGYVLDQGLGPSAAFDLIRQSLVNGLGGNLAGAFNDRCLSDTVGSLTAGKGFPLTNCLFQGLASKFCHDVVTAGPYSIAGGIGMYFSSFRDRVSASAVKLAETFVVVSLFGIAVASVINFIVLNIPGGIILAVILLIKILWYVFTWRQIQFAARLLRISLKFLKRNPAPFFLATFIFLWNALWCFVFAAAYLYLFSPTNVAAANVPSPTAFLNTLGQIILVLSFFWAFEVWKGILGTSIAGAMATWYYFKPEAVRYAQPPPRSTSAAVLAEPSVPATLTTASPGLAIVTSKPNLQLQRPVIRSFAQSITRSLGTICFASLILASLKTLHYFYRRAKNSRKPIFKLIVLTLLSCIENILRVFNLYAMVRVGVRHESFVQAARKTAGMIRERGVEAIVTDDGVDRVMSAGRIAGAITIGFVGWVVGISHKLDFDVGLLVLVISLLFGFAVLSVMAVTVEMSVAALFVMVAENPEAMVINHPSLCADLVKVVRGRCMMMGWAVPLEFDVMGDRSKHSQKVPSSDHVEMAATASHLPAPRHRRIPSDPLNESIYNLVIRPGDDRPPPLFKSKYATQVRAEHMASRRITNSQLAKSLGLVPDGGGGGGGGGGMAGSGEKFMSGGFLNGKGMTLASSKEKAVVKEPVHPRMVPKTSTGLHMTIKSGKGPDAAKKAQMIRDIRAGGKNPKVPIKGAVQRKGKPISKPTSGRIALAAERRSNASTPTVVADPSRWDNVAADEAEAEMLQRYEQLHLSNDVDPSAEARNDSSVMPHDAIAYAKLAAAVSQEPVRHDSGNGSSRAHTTGAAFVDEDEVPEELVAPWGNVAEDSYESGYHEPKQPRPLQEMSSSGATSHHPSRARKVRAGAGGGAAFNANANKDGGDRKSVNAQGGVARRMLPENERLAILAGLRANHRSLMELYHRMSVSVDTVSKINRKTSMEKQLQLLEDDIKKFSHPNIMVDA